MEVSWSPFLASPSRTSRSASITRCGLSGAPSRSPAESRMALAPRLFSPRNSTAATQGRSATRMVTIPWPGAVSRTSTSALS